MSVSVESLVRKAVPAPSDKACRIRYGEACEQNTLLTDETAQALSSTSVSFSNKRRCRCHPAILQQVSQVVSGKLQEACLRAPSFDQRELPFPLLSPSLHGRPQCFWKPCAGAWRRPGPSLNPWPLGMLGRGSLLPHKRSEKIIWQPLPQTAWGPLGGGVSLPL